MSLSVADIQTIFKIVGKGVFLTNLVNTHVQAYEKLMMGLASQANSGSPDDFDAFQNVIVPANTAIKGVITKLQSGTATAQSINENYLGKVVAVKLALASGAAITDVLDALQGEMIGNGVYLAPDGFFDMYVRSTWNFTTLPNAGTILIPESFIDDDVV
jgi:hypothetical protein